MPQEIVRFEGYESENHLKGSLGCTAGCCNNKDGFYANVTPVQCQCGGVIHGSWVPSSINDTYGPYDFFECDACHTSYDFDTVIEIKKASENHSTNPLT